MGRYASVTDVRKSSGFNNNTNITDAFVAGRITDAMGQIDSKISDAYQLPLPDFYEQTIAFSGTGTGSANLTITIDGNDYVIAVTNNMTAAEAADAFRTAALANTSYITDGLGDGATVTFYSRDDDDSAGVTVTSTDPQTVQGITATGGTVTTIAPPLIRLLATEIAAARMLIIEYGEEAQDTDKDGFKRLALWEEDLELIATKKKKLFNYAGEELARSTLGRLVFKPNDTTEVDADNPTDSRFTMNRKF